MLDTRRLLVLAEVHRRGSISSAAVALGYTVSAVSQQISKLEAEAGIALVRRDARGSHLTEAGRGLVLHAGRIERELRLAQEHLDDFAGLRRGTLRIGTFPTVAASSLPDAVRLFREQHPDITLRVRSARIAGLIDMLERREVELSLLWEYDWARLPTDAFEVLPLFEDPTMLLVSADHWITERGISDFADLANEGWVTRAQHPVAEVLTHTCQSAGFSPTIVYEASDYQESQAMVAVGLGIALAPRCALATLRTDVVSVNLGQLAPKRRILLAHIRGEHLTPAADAMATILERTTRTYWSEDASDLPAGLASPMSTRPFRK
jgi:DNA-binding transcriptional LysR family regulator